MTSILVVGGGPATGPGLLASTLGAGHDIREPSSADEALRLAPSRAPGPAARSDPGKLHHWLTSHYPVSLDDEVIGIGLVVVDITARKEAEALHSAVMDNMAVACSPPTARAV